MTPKLRRSNSNKLKISDSTILRLSKYYRALVYWIEHEVKTVSSEMLAKHIGVAAAQVRKDLSYFGAFGRRGLGYNVSDLKDNIARIMGLEKKWKVALVGVGNIGRAMLEYDPFRSQGFDIMLCFDGDSDKIGRTFHGVTVLNENLLENEISKISIDIVIIAVPVFAAQSVADRCVDAGVKGILNFAPINLNVPTEIFVKNENMAMEIESLSFALTNPELARGEASK